MVFSSIFESIWDFFYGICVFSTLCDYIFEYPDPVPTLPGCLPKLEGPWIPSVVYPLRLVEAQGAMIGDDLVVVGGFLDASSRATPQVWSLDTTNYSASWERQDDMPQPEGITHGAFVVIGTKFYICGGYIGGHPGPHTDLCAVYDHAADAGSQWSIMPPLPEPRGGAGMVYDEAVDALYFGGGAERPDPDSTSVDDFQHAWKFSFADETWTPIPDIPFLGNHMSFVTALDTDGDPHHFFVGGQVGKDERVNNNSENYELVVDSSTETTWVERQRMPYPRGHTSSSTSPFGCGYVMVAGSTNNGRTPDVTYYDYETDHWFKLGEAPDRLITPVCDIHRNWLVCESGFDQKDFSYRRRISVE